MPGESSRKDSPQVETRKRPVALLFELEHSAIAGRSISFEVCKKLFAEREIELTPPLFVRHCRWPARETCMTEFLDVVGKKRLSGAKLAVEVGEALKDAFTDKHLKMAGGFAKLVEKARKENAVLGALTALDPEVATGMIKKLGMDEMNLKLHYASPDTPSFPTADAWLKLAKAVGVPPAGCTVLTTSAGSCKAALSGGMKPVAFPDEFTSCQDFGGADLLIEKLSDEIVDSIIALMVHSR